MKRARLTFQLEAKAATQRHVRAIRRFLTGRRRVNTGDASTGERSAPLPPLCSPPPDHILLG